MKLLVVTDDFPLPANSGGRTDMWRRLLALREAGVELALLSWYDEAREGAPSPATLQKLEAVVATHCLLPIRRDARQLLARLGWLGRLPSHAAARWVAQPPSQLLDWARAFAPDALLLDRLFAAAPARWLAGRLERPWAYRSHNREALYMAGQLRRAAGWRSRMGLAVNQWGLARLERAVLDEAGAVLDISQVDAQHWAEAGVRTPLLWLPPAVDAGFVAELEAAVQAGAPQRWDALYFGNLNTPNNVEALRWWVQQVLPRLPQPDLRLGVAGSRPSAEARALLAGDARIELVADPPAMAPLLAQSKVLVNPMRSGSGVNLKSVEMLYAPAWLVSTPQGVLGLPEALGAQFARADEPAGFAQAMREALDRMAPDAAVQARRRELAACFAPSAHAATVLQGLAKAAERAASRAAAAEAQR